MHQPAMSKGKGSKRVEDGGVVREIEKHVCYVMDGVLITCYSLSGLGKE